MPSSQERIRILWESPAAAYTLVGFLAIVIAQFYLRVRVKGLLPPGPRRRWLIGNLLDMPRTFDMNIFMQWKHKYGDIVYLEALGSSILVLNSAQAVSDLFEKRGNLYSDRPQFVMSTELLQLKKSIAMYQYNSQFKELKRYAQQALSPTAILQYLPIQERIMFDYLWELQRNPDRFLDNLWYAIGRIIISVTYGIPVNDPNSEYILDAEAAMIAVGKATRPGAYLVDIVPSLRYLAPILPFMTWVKDAKYGKAIIARCVERPWKAVNENMAAGGAPKSFVSDILTDKAQLSRSGHNFEEGIKWAAGTMYAAGVETSYAAISCFFLLMSFNVDAQSKAQIEIDRVVGSDRTVCLDDRSHLPYVCALIQEVLRWHPPPPLGVARRLNTDDVYEGYHIPAGTLVMPNIWALSRTSNDAEAFRPERFLDGSETKNTTDYIFGHGRRLCPGKYMAENTLFLFMSNILARFNIRPLDKAKGGLGSIKEANFRPMLVQVPEAFKCDISPRSASSAEWVAQTAAELPPFDTAFVNFARSGRV